MDSSVFPTAGDKGGGVFPTHQPKICSSPPPTKILSPSRLPPPPNFYPSPHQKSIPPPD